MNIIFKSSEGKKKLTNICVFY